MLKAPSLITRLTALAAELPLADVVHVAEPSTKITVPGARPLSETLAGHPEYHVFVVLACWRSEPTSAPLMTGVPPAGLVGMVSGATWPVTYCLQLEPVWPVQRSETFP